MSEPVRQSGAWWAPSSKHAKRTALGTAAIVIALSLITWTVWASPSSPVSTAVHHALGVKTASEQAEDTKALQVKLAAAQKQIWKLEGQLKSASATGESRSSRIEALQAELQSAQSALGAAQAAAASTSGTTTASTTSGGSGSTFGSSGSKTATASGGSKAAATGTSGASKEPSATPVDVPTKAELLDPTARYYGLYTAQSPGNWAEYDEISQKVGTATNMDGYFQGFQEPFKASAVQRSWANGRLPMMTWETTPSLSGNDQTQIPGYDNADIMGPAYSAYITKYAQDIVANGQPMVIRFDHEMNGSWYNWSESPKQNNAAKSYVAMWQYVHDVFQAQGANDYVIWDWSPTRIDKLGNEAYEQLPYLANYYPTDAYVDWVGMSGYYRDSTEAPTFETTFAATLDQIRKIAKDKPIVLNEIGATETGGDISDPQKVQWVTSLFDALADPANDDIIGFAYFNESATTVTNGELTSNDWRIDSRAASLAAFVAGMQRIAPEYGLKEIEK